MAALNPQRYVKVLGSSFVKDYAERPILTIGKDNWTRAELARLGVVQAKSCSILSGIAAKLKVQSLKELYATTSPYSLADFPCGVVTLYVLFAVFLDRDLEPDAWYRAGKERALVTFLSLKARELESRARERADAKRRTTKSRRQSHEHGVKAFLQATGAKA